MTIESPARHLIAVQMLRAIAATMVVFVHIDTELARLHFRPLGSGWLSSGVDIFFVISGFIMWTSVERKPEISAMGFLHSRLIRIVPLYWLMTLTVVTVAFFLPQTLHTAKLEPLHVIASFLFLPARHPTTGLFWPLLVQGWSLNYEMLFYAVFALAIAMGLKRNSRFMLIAAVMFAILAAGQAAQSSVDVAQFYANPVIIEFIVGMALGAVWSSGHIKSNYVFVLVSVAGFFVLWPGSNLYWTPPASVGAAMIVGGAIFLPSLPENQVSRLGDASYSLYLTHTVVLSALTFACQALALRIWAPAFIAASLICAIAAAFAMHTRFERPVTALLKKAFAARKGATPSEPAEPNVPVRSLGGCYLPASISDKSRARESIEKG